MNKYRVWGKVVGTKYLGEFEAESEEEAEQMALESENAAISLCHECISECEDPACEEVTVEMVEEIEKRNK